MRQQGGDVHIYTYAKDGVKITAHIIQVSDGYRATPFVSFPTYGSWLLMDHTYKTLSGLLRAACDRGYNVQIDDDNAKVAILAEALVAIVHLGKDQGRLNLPQCMGMAKQALEEVGWKYE
jgi:hypothetical protein